MLDKLILSPWDLTPPSPASRPLSPGQYSKAIYFLASTHHTAFLGLFILSSMSQFYPSSSTYLLNLYNLLLWKKKKELQKMCPVCKNTPLGSHAQPHNISLQCQESSEYRHFVAGCALFFPVWRGETGSPSVVQAASNSQLVSSHLSLLNPGMTIA